MRRCSYFRNAGCLKKTSSYNSVDILLRNGFHIHSNIISNTISQEFKSLRNLTNLLYTCLYECIQQVNEYIHEEIIRNT